MNVIRKRQPHGILSLRKIFLDSPVQISEAVPIVAGWFASRWFSWSWALMRLHPESTSNLIEPKSNMRAFPAARSFWSADHMKNSGRRQIMVNQSSTVFCGWFSGKLNKLATCELRNQTVKHYLRMTPFLLRTFFLKTLLLLFVSIAMTIVLYMTFNGRHLGKELKSEFIPDGYPIFKLAFNPSGTRLAIGTWYGITSLYDPIASIMLKYRLKGNASVTSLTFSSDGAMIAIGYADGTASIYRATEEMIPVVSKLYLDVQIRKLTISPDNKYLIAQGSSSLTIWKIHADDVEMIYKGDGCHDFALAEAGSLIISIHFNGTVSIQKINDGVIMGHEFDLIAFYRGVSVSEHGKIVALFDETKTDIYKVENNKLKRLSTIVSPTDFATVSPNGKSLAIADYFGTVSVWDIPSGTKILTLRCHTDRINAISFSPDSLSIATGSQDQRVRLWIFKLIVSESSRKRDSYTHGIKEC